MVGLALALIASFAPNTELPQGQPNSIHSELLDYHWNTPSFLEHYVYRPFKENSDATPATQRFNGIVYGYLPYWAELNDPIPWQHLTHLAYFSVEMNSDGSLGLDHGWESFGASLVEAGEAQGVAVVLTATYMSNSGIRTLLDNPTSRQAAIDNLIAKVQAVGGHGVNIDFEFVPSAEAGESPTPKENFVTFMTDLTTAFHASIPGSHVSLATPAVDWNGSYDYDELATNTDGMMIMGYGYHWKSGNPGPLAPVASGDTWGVHNLSWTINDYKQWGLEENSDKFILGLPLYGRDWPSTDHTVPGQATGDGAAISLAQCDTRWNNEKLWDEDSQTPYRLYFDEGNPHQFFCEDIPSMEAKFDLIHTATMGGVMFWDLGKVGANHSVWSAVDASFKLTEPEPEPEPEPQENQEPHAHISATRNGFIHTPITLDGRHSFDPDNDELTFSWELIGGPPVPLGHSTAPTLTITATEIGYYSFRLTVSDGLLQHSTHATLSLSRQFTSADIPESCAAASPPILLFFCCGLWLLKRRTC